MANKTELNLNELENVTGGVIHTINTGVDGLDAAIRNEPRKASKQIGHIANGEKINTISDDLVYDPVTQRHYVQVQFGDQVGWIASSILGLKR